MGIYPLLYQIYSDLVSNGSRSLHNTALDRSRSAVANLDSCCSADCDVDT